MTEKILYSQLFFTKLRYFAQAILCRVCSKLPSRSWGNTNKLTDLSHCIIGLCSWYSICSVYSSGNAQPEQLHLVLSNESAEQKVS